MKDSYCTQNVPQYITHVGATLFQDEHCVAELTGVWVFENVS